MSKISDKGQIWVFCYFLTIFSKLSDNLWLSFKIASCSLDYMAYNVYMPAASVYMAVPINKIAMYDLVLRLSFLGMMLILFSSNEVLTKYNASCRCFGLKSILS